MNTITTKVENQIKKDIEKYGSLYKAIKAETLTSDKVNIDTLKVLYKYYLVLIEELLHLKEFKDFDIDTLEFDYDTYTTFKQYLYNKGLQVI